MFGEFYLQAIHFLGKRPLVFPIYFSFPFSVFFYVNSFFKSVIICWFIRRTLSSMHAEGSTPRFRSLSFRIKPYFLQVNICYPSKWQFGVRKNTDAIVNPRLHRLKTGITESTTFCDTSILQNNNSSKSDIG